MRGTESPAMNLSYSSDELIAMLQPVSVRGCTESRVTGIAALTEAEKGDLSFLGNAKYKAQVQASRASVLLLPVDYVGEPGAGQLYLYVANPSASLATFCSRIEQSLWPKPQPGVHPSAVVDPSATISPTATIGPLCVVEGHASIGAGTHLQAQVYLGRGVQVGADCWLQPGVSISAECEIHDRVRLQSGVVIGSDGFGYEFVQGRHVKVPQVGRVVVESDVEIGANTTVDRARFSRTVIGEGTKIDNLVQVAHNVIIGKHCILCAQVGISGSTTLEDYVILGGQVGLGGHIRIGRGAKVDGKSSSTIDLEPGAFVKGSPALPYQLEQRINVLRKRLPELFKRVDALEAHLVDLKKTSAH